MANTERVTTFVSPDLKKNIAERMAASRRSESAEVAILLEIAVRTVPVQHAMPPESPAKQ